MASVTGTSADKSTPGVSGEHTTGTGVRGRSNTGTGVLGTSESGIGAWGGSQSSTGVGGQSRSGIGVHGVSTTNEGVRADTKSPSVAALAAYNNNPEGTGAAVYGKKAGNKGHAGFFDGDVHVTGNLTIDGDVILSRRHADCAEDFDVADVEPAEPGTVMVVGEEGVLQQSCQAYDKRVAGVISGAGEYKPGIVLDKQHFQSNRQPIALLGKVFCKVDAHHASIEVGDLLTTSDTPGHAMKAVDPLQSFGSVIGKALRPLKEGQGLIPILIALQ